MARPTLQAITAAIDTNNSLLKINENFDAIEAAFADTLSRAGYAPNYMDNTLDMNGNRITNLPNAVNATEPVTLAQAGTIAGFTALTQAVIGSYLWPRTSEEIAASVTPTYYYYPPGDVRRYGAVGDNATDDTTALVNAGKSSKIVYIDPSLTCRVTATLSAGIQSGQRWYGGGAITTANGFNFSVFAVIGKTDVTIEGLTMTSGTLGVAIATADARAIDFISSSHRCKAINNKITGFQQAVRVNASADCQVLNNRSITPYGWGISVQTDADYCLVDGNRVSDCAGEHGIYVSGSNGNQIIAPIVVNNHVSGSTIDGIKMIYTVDPTVGHNVSASNGGQGIYLSTGTNRAKVHDNAVYSNTGNGILVYTGTASDTLDRNLIHHNTVYLNVQDGIRVQVGSASASITHTIVSENICHDNNQAAGSFRGISLSVSSGTNSGTQVTDNFVTSETTAINIGASVTGAVLSRNRFNSNTTNISDGGTNTVIDQVTRGVTASVADGGTITHGHVKTPTSARVTASTSAEFVSVTAIGATTITVAIKKHDGTAGTTQTLYWEVAG